MEWGLRRTAAIASSSSSSSSSPLNASTALSNARRGSVYGTHDRVVLNVGSSFLQVGLSGETSCRGVITTSHDCCCWESVLSQAYVKILMTDPSLRKVIVCDKPLLSIQFKERIANILLKSLRVPAVSFVSSDLLALICTGSTTGLVMDVGHEEATVMPIYDGRPLYQLVRFAPLGGKALATRLKQLVMNHASIVYTTTATSLKLRDILSPSFSSHPPSSTITEVSNSASEHDQTTTSNSMKSLLSLQPDEFWHKLAAQICFVAPSSLRSEISLSANKNPLGAYAIYDSKATDVCIRVPAVIQSINTEQQQQQQPTAILIKIPGWVRERAAEVWFEGPATIPHEDDSLISLLLDALVKCPIDIRTSVANGGVVLCGGGAMLAGLGIRIEGDLKAVGAGDRGSGMENVAIASGVNSLGSSRSGSRMGSFSLPPGNFYTGEESGRRRAQDRFDNVRRLVRDKIFVARTVFQPNMLTWIGGSLAGSLKIIHSELILEDYLAIREGNGNHLVPDWTKLEEQSVDDDGDCVV